MKLFVIIAAVAWWRYCSLPYKFVGVRPLPRFKRLLSVSVFEVVVTASRSWIRRSSVGARRRSCGSLPSCESCCLALRAVFPNESRARKVSLCC